MYFLISNSYTCNSFSCKRNISSLASVLMYRNYPDYGYITLQGNYNSYNCLFPQLSFSSPQEKQSPRLSPENISVTSGNTASPGAVLPNKTRIRWTQDLHEKFVGCVNYLGGAESK